MGIDLPEPLRWLFKLTGSEWPDADEDKIARFGEQVGGFSDKIDSVNSNMVDTVRLANLSNSGPAMTQYTDNLRDVVNNGMPGMSVGARAMAGEIHDAALQVEYSKGTAVINMAIMAPMIVDAIASAPETFGATMAVAEAGIAAVRTTVPKLLMQMVEKVVTNTAMMEAGDLAVQGYQVLVKRDRAGFDSNLSLNTIEMGAIGGAVDGALTGALMKGAPKFFKSAEAGVTDANKLIWAPPKWANMATQVANNTVTSLIMDGINHQPIDGLSLLQGAALGAAMGGLHHAPGVKVKQFDAFHMNEDFLNGDSWVRPTSAYARDRTGTNDFSFNVRRQPGTTDGTKTVWYGDPNVAHPDGAPPLDERLGSVIDKTLENHPEGAPKPRFTVLEDVPPAQLDGIRALAADKGADIVVPHGAVETGPFGSLRVPGSDGGSGFRMVHPDGTVEHLGSVYDPRQTVSDPIVGGEPPETRVALGSAGEKFVSKEVAGEGDCTVASLADSALSQGVGKKSIHAEGLNLSDPGDMREFRNRIADQVTSQSTDTRPGSGVLLGELSPDAARTVLDRLGPPKTSSSSHIAALDLAGPATPRVTTPRIADPVRDLSSRLQQEPARVLSALERHYSSDGDKGMAQLAAYAKAKVEAGGNVPQHRDLLDYAIRERTLAETPLGGEMLQAVAHTLGLDVVVVSGDKPAFHLNGDAPKRVYIHRVTTEDGRNHYRALRPETKPAPKLNRRPPQAPQRVPVSSRGGHGAITRRPTGSVSNALHRLAGGAHDPNDHGLMAPTTPHPPTPRPPHQDVSALMQRSGHAHDAPPRTPDGFEATGGPDVMGIRAVPDKPAFLADRFLDKLPPANSPRFFEGIDLARPDGPPHDLGDLFTGSEAPHDPPRIPHLLHSIWLGGPLHADGGDRQKFMEVMGSNADKTGYTSVLWTDVPRHEINELRALGPDAPRTPRQEQIQQMLDWAGAHNVRLANVEEVFAGGDRAELHTEIATERARTTGSGYAGASDLLRLDILHRFGGVYTDGDNKATGKLAELVDTVEADQEHGQFGISSLNGSINNSAFIAPPGNRIVHAYRASLKERYAAPLRAVLTEKFARGKAAAFRDIWPLQDHVRFDNRDVRSEVIIRTGPTAWSYDKLAREAGAPENPMGERRWFTTITKDHLETGSESAWLSDTAPRAATGHAPAYLEPEKTVKAAVTILHREAVNREGILHLPSVMDIVDKAAPEHREQVWHAVLHTMHETWPSDRYPKPDIVVSGRFQTASKKGDPVARNQSIPRSVKTYLNGSGLFPDATVHAAVGHEMELPPDDRLREALTGAGLRNVPTGRARDVARVHKMLFNDTHLSDPERVRQAAKVLDLLHATSPRDGRADHLWAPKALRDLVEFRIGDEGNYAPEHLDTLLADHNLFMRRDRRTQNDYRHHVEYIRAVPDGKDPEKFAGSMSPRPPSRTFRRLSPGQHADRWDRAVDVMALDRELGGLTPQQERGLWKLVGLYRKTPGHAFSERPLTLHDMAEFRNELSTRHPELGTVTDPKAWTLKMAERSYALSPESGKLRLNHLVQHAQDHPDEPQQPQHYGPDSAIGKRGLPAFQHPAEADRFRAQYVEARPGGSGIWIRDPRSQHDMQTRHTSTTMRAEPGHFSVITHGSSQQVHVGKTSLSARDLANLLQHTPEWRDNPRPIRLVACNTGEDDHGFAQQLADLLGVEVKAPNTVVWGVPNGKPYASTLVRRPDGTYRPAKEADGAYRVFTPRTFHPDGTVEATPIRLDTAYGHLGRKPALTVLSRAIAGPFGDKLAGADPVTQKIVNDWRHLMGQTTGDSEKAFEVSESARNALDKVLTPDTVQWMLQHAPADAEVNQALHVLSGSRSQHGEYDARPSGSAPSEIHHSPFPGTAPSDAPKSLSESLGGHVLPEGLKKLADVNLRKFPASADPHHEPQVRDFTDIVHQLLGPDHDVETGVATLAAAATRARRPGSLSSLDDALLHDDGDFVRAPWSRVRYEAYVPWSDRHSIERDAALVYYHAFGEHAPANPDAGTVRNMRRAVQVAKLAHSSYDRRGQSDPESFYRQLGDRLRPLPDETGSGGDSFKRLLHAAGSGDGRYQNPDFLAGPMRRRLNGPDAPRPALGHGVPAEHIAASRTLAKKLPGLYTPTDFGGHIQIETRLRALIPGRGPLHFEVGLPTELREGFAAMADSGLTLRVTRDGHAYDVHLKALLKSGPERVEETAAKAKNESRMFRTGDDGGGSHGTSRTLTVDGGVKVGYGPLSIGANAGASRIRSRELTSSEAFGGDIYLDPSDGTSRHIVETQVHIEVTDTATGHWLQDVPPTDGPTHAVELRIQDHLTATDGVDSTPHAVTRPLDDPSIDHLLGERTGYGDQLKHGFLTDLHDKGLVLEEKARAEVDGYFSELSSPHNVATLHSADPLRRAGLSTSITAKDSAGKDVAITLGAHAEAKTLTQVSTSRSGLKMDTVARHAVKQGVSTGRGGGLPSSLTGGVKAHDGTTTGIGVSGNSTRTETASLESAFTVTRTVRAEDENASYRLESKLDLHVSIGDRTEHFSVPDATAWVRLRTADHARLIGEDGAPERSAAAEGTDKLDPHLMTSEGLPLGQVKKISNLDGLYRDLTTKLADHLPDEASGDLAELFENDPTGSFLHGTGDKHENWRRVVAAVSGPGLVQRADALTGEGVTVKLRIDGQSVPLRLSLGGLKPADAACLGADDKLMPISVHQASQTSRIRSSKQQDLTLNTSLGVGTGNGLFNATITGRRTKTSRSTVSGGVRQYTRSLSGSTLFDVGGGKLSWKLEHAEKPIEGAVDGGLHLWVSSDLVKATSDLGKPLPLRPLDAHEHSPLATTPIHMAVSGRGMDALRAQIAKKNPDLASEFGTGRFSAELPLLSGGGVRVAPGVHWDVTPTGRPQVLKTMSVYVESHGEAGTAVDHDLEVRQGKGGSGFGGGKGDGLTGGVTVSHSRDTAQGSSSGHGENSSRLMTAKTVQMALVRTRVRHRVTGVRRGQGDGDRPAETIRPIETIGETLVMVPLSELHNRQEHFDFPADTPEKIFENFTAPGEGDPSPALRSGMLFGPVGAHPDGGLGLEAAAKADEAFGDRDLNDQVRDLLQTPTLASQIRKLSDGGLTHPIVTAGGGRYELRIQAKTIGRPVLHDTNATGGAKMYNADMATSAERSGGSKTTSGAATFGIDTPQLSLTATHTRSGVSGDVETRARRDIESGGLRFSGESVDEYRQGVEYTYSITRLSHPLWNLHFVDRPPETLQKSVSGSYVSELRAFEPTTRALETTAEGRPTLSDHAVMLDWHGQEKISTLFREAGGTEQRHAPQDAVVLSKGSFTASLHDVLKPGGSEFRGVDLAGRTLMMKRGVRVEGTLKPPKSVAFLKAGAERESFSHRAVSTTAEHSDSAKQETKSQVSASGVTPHGVTVGGRAGIGHATEEREKTSETHSTETRPRWDREPGGLFAVHVPVELKLDFGRGGAPRSTTVDVLVHVDAAGAEALGVPAAKLRELRGEPEPAHEPVVPHEPVLDAIPIDDATHDELTRFTTDELARLEGLARDSSPEDFRRLVMRASLSPGSFPEAALLERVPSLQSRDHVLQAVQQIRAHEPVPYTAPTHASVTPLVEPFIRPDDDSVTVHTVPAGTTVFRLVDIRTALAHLTGRIEPLNRLGWIHLGRGLYTAADREGAALYDDDRFDRVMLRLTPRRDMVGMNIRESGTNAAEIGHQLGERHNGVVDITPAGRNLLDGADFVAVHNGEEAPHEIKFHDGALEHFDVSPDDASVTEYGDGVLAVYGDWAQRAEHLPPGTDYVLSTTGRLATGSDLPWHQVTGEHVRQLADTVGLPHDRLGELHDLIPAHLPDTVEELREALNGEEEPQPFALIKGHQDDRKALGEALAKMSKPKYDAFRAHAGYQDVADKAAAVAGQTDDRGHLAAVNDLHAAVERFTDSLPPDQQQKFEHTDLYNATGQAFARVSIVELRLRRDDGAFKVHVGHDFADDTARDAWVKQFTENFTESDKHVLWIRNDKHPQDTALKASIDAMKAGPDRRYFSVALHGSPGSVHVGNGHLSVKEMAALIRADEHWNQNKQPIRLFSCYTGMDDHGYAHELAKELGVDVIAPNDKAWADRNGNTYVSENLYTYDANGVPRVTPKRKSPDTGAWRRFSPDGSVKLELAPGTKLGRTAALTLLTRTLPRTEDEIKTWPEAAHEPLRELAGVLATSDTLFERHLIDSHMNAMRDALSNLLDDSAVGTLTTHVPAGRHDIREALQQLVPDPHNPNASQTAHEDPVPFEPVAFTIGDPTRPEAALADITTRLGNHERIWVRDTQNESSPPKPLTLVDGVPHVGAFRLLPRHMKRLEIVGFPERLSHADPGEVPEPSVKTNGNQRMLFHNTSLMFGHFTGDIVRAGGADRFGNQHLTVDKALPALFANLATQDPATVQIFLSLIHHDRHLAGTTMTGNGFVAPANIHFRPDPAQQRAIPLPAWLGRHARHDNPPPDPEPTEVNRQVTYARFRTFVDSRLVDLGFPEDDRRELIDSLDWTASRFHSAPDTMSDAERDALFAGLYLNAGERLDFSKKAVVLQRLSGHDVPAPLNLIVRDTSRMTPALQTSLQELHADLLAGSAEAATIQALLNHTGDLRPAAPPLNAAISVIMEHYWPTILGWMPPPE